MYAAYFLVVLAFALSASADYNNRNSGGWSSDSKKSGNSGGRSDDRDRKQSGSSGGRSDDRDWNQSGSPAGRAASDGRQYGSSCKGLASRAMQHIYMTKRYPGFKPSTCKVNLS